VKLLQTAAGLARKTVASIAAAFRPRPPLSQNAIDEADYVEFINARAAEKRSERSRTWDELVGGGGWLPRRPGWTKRW
jgi:hypothetical protein